MKIEIDVKSINYEQVADLLLPEVGKKIEEKSGIIGRVFTGRKVRKATGKLINKIPDSKKNEYTAKLINKNSNRIAKEFEKMAKTKGVDVDIRKITVKP